MADAGFEGDVLAVYCPSCSKEFTIDLPGHEPEGNLIAACDHCGHEAPLKKFIKARDRRLRAVQKDAAKKREIEETIRRAKERQATEALLAKYESQADTRHSAAETESSAPPPLAGDSAPVGGGFVGLPGGGAPKLALLPGEQVADRFEANFWDIGLWGWIFRHKHSLVLTNRRVIGFQKKTIDSLLEIILLEKVRKVTVGRKLSASTVVVACALISSMLYVLTLNVIVAVKMTALFLLVVGILLLVLAHMKVFEVSAGEDKIQLRLRRVKSAESRRFVEKIFDSMARLNSPEGEQ